MEEEPAARHEGGGLTPPPLVTIVYNSQINHPERDWLWSWEEHLGDAPLRAPGAGDPRGSSKGREGTRLGGLQPCPRGMVVGGAGGGLCRRSMRRCNAAGFNLRYCARNRRLRWAETSVESSTRW